MKQKNHKSFLGNFYRLIRSDDISDMEIQAPEFDLDFEKDDEEIEEFTDDANTKVWGHTLERTHYYKVVKFYVNDLLQSSKQHDHFVFQNTAFVYVHICGTVLSNTIHKKKLHFEVNDGTGTIDCSLDDDYFNISQSVNYVHLQDNLHKQPVKNNIILQGTSLVSSSLRNMNKVLLKDEQDLKIGDVVSLVGKLSEHNGVFYIFGEKLIKKNVSDFIEHLIEQKLFYDNLEGAIYKDI